GVSWAKDYNWTYIKNVKTDFGAKGDNATNDSQAIQNAIDNVATNGGGIVYFPNGTYLHKSFVIKTGVILKGQDKNNTIIKYNGTGSSTSDGGDAVIKSSGTGIIGITNLTLTADMSKVTAQTTKLTWFNFNSEIFLYNMKTDFPIAATQAAFKDFGWCGWMSAGKFLVSGCTMKGTAFYTPHIPQTQFINNTVEIGFGEISLWGNKSIFEGNHIMGSTISTSTQHGFFIDVGAGSVKNSYYNNNIVENVSSFTNQGEAFSTDGTGTYAEGPVTNATANTVTITKDVVPGRGWTNSSQVLVVKGKGLGQKINISSYTQNGNTITVTLTKNWTVQPDATSKCIIGDFTEDVVAENMSILSCKVGMQFYCNGYDNIMNANTLSNTQGILIWAWQNIGTYFCSIRNNNLSGASPDANINNTWIGIRDENDNTKNDYARDVYGIEYRDNAIDRKGLGGGGNIVRSKWVCMAFGYNNGNVTSGKGISALLLENNTLSNFSGGVYISPGVDGIAERATTFKNISSNLYTNEGSNNVRLTGTPDIVGCTVSTGISYPPLSAAFPFLIYPNPANQLAIINYQLENNSEVKISIWDILGKEEMQIANEKQTAGEHELTINTTQLQNGIYFVRISSDNLEYIQKLIISKQ
nr:T9SS type A sorting domain-containing protein [Bacteroidota bacterium]